MATFRDLIIWQKAMSLVTETYRYVSNFSEEEVYGLTSQMRRCSISIPSNIAEGYGRRGKKDFCKFLNIAMSSLFELQTQYEIASNLNYMEKDVFQKSYENTREIERMLSSYIRKVEMSI
ncbi:four helix bundle protein [Aquimarina sp. W85]|uniref:four helix bundle protein n=1 Tax=Aquimarina rhodophyticola TaxID=3342246 RepID=UPI0036727E04